MRRPRPEPLSLEEFELRQALDATSRRVVIGLLVAPFLSGAWAATAAQARAMDIGSLNAARVLDKAHGLDGLICAFLFVVGYETVGTRGLHVIFAALIVSALCVVASGRVKRHALQATYGVEALRDFRRAEREASAAQIIAAKPELAASYQAAKSRPLRPHPREIPAIRGRLRHLGSRQVLLLRCHPADRRVHLLALRGS